MADISKLNLDSTDPSSPVYNLKDEYARFERISYTQWQQMTPEQQAAKPYYIYDYPSERIINAENVGYDNTESGLAATQVQDAIDELNSGLMGVTANDFYETDDITAATPETAYVCPSDGYLLVSSDIDITGIIRVVIMDATSGNAIGYIYMYVVGEYQTQTLFLRKGLKVFVLMRTANTVVRFSKLG